MEKRVAQEQIIGFTREADTGLSRIPAASVATARLLLQVAPCLAHRLALCKAVEQLGGAADTHLKQRPADQVFESAGIDDTLRKTGRTRRRAGF